MSIKDEYINAKIYCKQLDTMVEIKDDPAYFFLYRQLNLTYIFNEEEMEQPIKKKKKHDTN